MTDYAKQINHNKPYIETESPVREALGVLATWLGLAAFVVLVVLGAAQIIRWIF